MKFAGTADCSFNNIPIIHLLFKKIKSFLQVFLIFIHICCESFLQRRDFAGISDRIATKSCIFLHFFASVLQVSTYPKSFV